MSNKFVFDTNVLIKPNETITECFDPNDNKFLELAVACQASCIVSGDPHLLDLHPFRTIPIMTPSNSVSVPISHFIEYQANKVFCPLKKCTLSYSSVH